jgi:hypothetical protein
LSDPAGSRFHYDSESGYIYDQREHAWITDLVEAWELLETYAELGQIVCDTETPAEDLWNGRDGMAVELERENAELKSNIAQMQKDYGYELQDPAGTIWDACAQLQKRNQRLERENAELKAEILRAELLVLQGSSGLEREIAELRAWVALIAPMYSDLVCYVIDNQDIAKWPECMEGCQGLLETCPLNRDEWKGGEG